MHSGLGSIPNERANIDPDQPVQGGADSAYEHSVANWFAKTRFAASLLGAFSAPDAGGDNIVTASGRQ